MAIFEQCKLCRHFHPKEDSYCDKYSEYIRKPNGVLCEDGGGVALDTLDERLKCPVCGAYTHSLKLYNLPKLDLFALFFRYHIDDVFICCPSCMRRKILLRGFTYNILTANIIWPFIVLPRMIVKLIRTTTYGHSKELMQP